MAEFPTSTSASPPDSPLQLNAEERILCARLSVFADGWTPEAVTKVVAGEGLPETDLPALLSGLATRSVIVAVPQSGEARYRLHESVVTNSAEQLCAGPEKDRVHSRHRDWYLALAEEAEPQLEGADLAPWLNRLEVEHNNLRVALEWCASKSGEAEKGLRLAGALSRFWDVRGYWSEGLTHFRRLLGATPDLRTTVRAKALNGAGLLASLQGDYAGARALYEESLLLYREHGDKQGTADLLICLAVLELVRYDFPVAQALIEESLNLFRELDDKNGVADALHILGNLRYGMEDYASAQDLYEEALALKRALNDPRGVAFLLHSLGTCAIARTDIARAMAHYEHSLSLLRHLQARPNIAMVLADKGDLSCSQGAYTSAQACYEESLAIYRALGDDEGVMRQLRSLGTVAYATRDTVTAFGLFAESLRIANERADRTNIAVAMERIAVVLCSRKQARKAVWLWSAAQSLRESAGTPLSRQGQAYLEEHIALARSALREPGFTTAWEEGKAMSLDETVACALDVPPPDLVSYFGKILRKRRG